MSLETEYRQQLQLLASHTDDIASILEHLELIATADTATIDGYNGTAQVDTLRGLRTLVDQYVSGTIVPTATANDIGGIKVGDGLTINEDAVASVPLATSNTAGRVAVGSGISINNGEISVGLATTTTAGGIRICTADDVNGRAEENAAITPATLPQMPINRIYDGADSYTWAQPSTGARVRYIKGFLIGGGGGGGKDRVLCSGGAAGGAAFFSIEVFNINTINIVIGAGGAGRTSTAGSGSGATGGTSTMQTDDSSVNISASGGQGGRAASSTIAPPQGGNASGGYLNVRGASASILYDSASAGAPSYLGGGGAGGNQSSVTGQAATCPGAGGGGGSENSPGGNGAAGILVLEEYF